MPQYTDVIRIGWTFIKALTPSSAWERHRACRQALKAAAPWQTALSLQAAIVKNKACHGEAMTPNLYEISIPQAPLPSRKNMPLMAGNRRSEGAKPFHPLLMHIDDVMMHR